MAHRPKPLVNYRHSVSNLRDHETVGKEGLDPLYYAGILSD